MWEDENLLVTWYPIQLSKNCIPVWSLTFLTIFLKLGSRDVEIGIKICYESNLLWLFVFFCSFHLFEFSFSEFLWFLFGLKSCNLHPILSNMKNTGTFSDAKILIIWLNYKTLWWTRNLIGRWLGIWPFEQGYSFYYHCPLNQCMKTLF